MIIRKLELNNFLSHDHTALDFDKGVTVIYGHNGAGKSSIIDAIKFALFGEKRGSSIADLIRRGAQDMSVSLDFSIGDNEYNITRQMSLGRTGIRSRDAILTENKSELARTVSGVDDTVGGILGIDKDTFLNSVFVEQGEIDTLISKTKAERENTFNRILGLNLLSQYASSLGELSRETESRLLSFSGISDDMDRVSAAIGEKRNGIASLVAKLSLVQNEKGKIMESLKGAEERKNSIQGDLAGKRASASSLEARRKALTSAEIRLDRRSKDIRDLRQKFEALSAEIDNDLLSKADAIGDYFVISDSISPKRERLKDLEERLERVREMAREIRSLEPGYKAYTALERKLAELREQRPALEQNEAKYKSDLNRLSEVETDLAARRKEFDSAASGMESRLGISELSEEKVQSARAEAESARMGLETRVQEIKSSIGRINNDLKDIKANMDTLSGSSKCPLCLQPLTGEHMAQMKAEYEGKEESLRKSQVDLASEKGNLDGRKAELETRLASLNSPEVASALINAKYLGTLTEEREKLKASLAALEKDHAAFSTHREEVIETEKKMNNLRYSYDRYRSFELTISSSDMGDLEKKLEETREEIRSSEEELQRMEDKIDYKPDPGLRQKIRDMREKERVHSKVYQDLFALTTTQKGEEEQIESIKKDISDLESQVSGLETLEQEFSSASSRFDEINGKLQSSIGEEASLRALVSTEEKSLEELRVSLEGLEKQKASQESLRKSVTMINRLRACFDREGIQKAIRKDSAVYITNKVREYSSSFNLDFDDVMINEEMSIDVSQNGNMESIDMLSGGEKVALAIALRLSLATYVMESIKTIVMDEPTTYLDEDRRNNLKDIIQYTFRGDESLVPQMVIVTHHKELGSVADNVFEVSKRSGASRVSQG